MAEPNMEGYEQTEVPTQELAFIAEKTLKTLTTPANLNSGDLHNIYVRRQDDFEEPELLEVQYADSRGGLIRELIFVDPVYAEKRPRICVSIEGVQAMHRAIGVLSRKVDNLVHTLRSCRAAYYHELTSLREQVYQVSFAMEHGKEAPKNMKMPQLGVHEALYFDPSQFDTSISDEILERKLKDATKDINEKLKASREEVKGLEKRLRLYEREGSNMNDPRNKIERLLETVTLEKMLEMIRASMGRANMDDFYEVIRNMLNEWKIEKGMEPDKTVEEELDETKRQVKSLLSQLSETQARCSAHQRETDEVKKTLVTEREEAKRMNTSLVDNLEAARQELNQLRESVRGAETSRAQETSAYEKKKDEMEARLAEITAELADKEQSLKRYVAAKRMAEAAAGKKVENLSPEEAVTLAAEKMNKKEVASLVMNLTGLVGEEEKASLSSSISGTMSAEGRAKVVKALVQDGATPAIIEEVAAGAQGESAQKILTKVIPKLESKHKQGVVKALTAEMDEEDRVNFAKELPDQTLKAVVVESVNNLAYTIASRESDSEDSVEEGKKGKVLFDPANDLTRKARRALLEKCIKRLPGMEIKQLAQSMGPKARSALYETVFEEQDCDNIRRAASMIMESDSLQALAQGLSADAASQIVPMLSGKTSDTDFKKPTTDSGSRKKAGAGVAVQTDLQGIGICLLPQEQHRKMNRLAGRPTSGPSIASFAAKAAKDAEAEEEHEGRSGKRNSRRKSETGLKRGSLEIPKKRFDSAASSEAGSQPVSPRGKDPEKHGGRANSRKPSVSANRSPNRSRRPSISGGSEASRPNSKPAPSTNFDLSGLSPEPRGFTPPAGERLAADSSASDGDKPGTAESRKKTPPQAPKDPEDSAASNGEERSVQAQTDALQNAADQRREVLQDMDAASPDEMESDADNEDHDEMEEEEPDEVKPLLHHHTTPVAQPKRDTDSGGRPSEIERWIKNVFPSFEASTQTVMNIGSQQRVIQFQDLSDEVDHHLEKNCLLEMCDMVLDFYVNLQQSGIARRAVKKMGHLKDTVNAMKSLVMAGAPAGEVRQMLATQHMAQQALAEQPVHCQPGVSEQALAVAAAHAEAVSTYGPNSEQAAAASAAYAEVFAAESQRLPTPPPVHPAFSDVHAAGTAHIEALVQHGEDSAEAAAASERYAQTVFEKSAGQAAEFATQAAYTQALAEGVVADTAEALLKFEDAVKQKGGLSKQALSASQRYVQMMAHAMGTSIESLLQPVQQSQTVMHQDSTLPPEALAAAACYSKVKHADMPPTAQEASADYFMAMLDEGGLDEEAFEASESFAKSVDQQAAIPQAILSSSFAYTKNRLMALALSAEAKPGSATADSQAHASDEERSSSSHADATDGQGQYVNSVLLKALQAQKTASEMQAASAQQAEIARMQRTSGMSAAQANLMNQAPEMQQHMMEMQAAESHYSDQGSAQAASLPGSSAQSSLPATSAQIRRLSNSPAMRSMMQQVAQGQQPEAGAAELMMQNAQAFAQAQNAARGVPQMMAPMQALAQAQQSASMMMPMQALAQVPQSASMMMPMQALAQTPQSASMMAPMQSLAQPPQSASMMAPMQSLAQTPQSTAMMTPMQAFAQTPQTMQALAQPPQSASMMAPMQALAQAPLAGAGGLQMQFQVCSSCGNQFMPDAAYCRKCGTKRPGANEAPPTAADQKRGLKSFLTDRISQQVASAQAAMPPTQAGLAEDESAAKGQAPLSSSSSATDEAAVNQSKMVDPNSATSIQGPVDSHHEAPELVQQVAAGQQAPPLSQDQHDNFEAPHQVVQQAPDVVALTNLHSHACAKHGPTSAQALALTAAVAETTALEMGLSPELAGATANEVRCIVEGMDQMPQMVAATHDFAQALQEHGRGSAQAMAASESYAEAMTQQSTLPPPVAAAKGAQVSAIAQHGERSVEAARSTTVLVRAVAEQVAVAAAATANARGSSAGSSAASGMGAVAMALGSVPRTPMTPQQSLLTQSAYGMPHPVSAGQVQAQIQEQQRLFQEQQRQFQEQQRQFQEQQKQIQEKQKQMQEEHRKQVFTAETVQSSAAAHVQAVEEHGLQSEQAEEATVAYTEAVATQSGLPPEKVAEVTAQVRDFTKKLSAPEITHERESFSEALAQHGPATPQAVAASEKVAEAIASSSAMPAEVKAAAGAQVRSIAQHGPKSEEAANATVAYVQAVAESVGAVVHPQMPPASSPPGSQGLLAPNWQLSDSVLPSMLPGQGWGQGAQQAAKFQAPSVQQFQPFGQAFPSTPDQGSGQPGSVQRRPPPVQYAGTVFQMPQMVAENVNQGMLGWKVDSNVVGAPSAPGHSAAGMKGLAPGMPGLPSGMPSVPFDSKNVERGSAAWAQIRAVGALHGIKKKKESVAPGAFTGLGNNIMMQDQNSAFMQAPSRLPVMSSAMSTLPQHHQAGKPPGAPSVNQLQPWPDQPNRPDSQASFAPARSRGNSPQPENVKTGRSKRYQAADKEARPESNAAVAAMWYKGGAPEGDGGGSKEKRRNSKRSTSKEKVELDTLNSANKRASHLTDTSMFKIDAAKSVPQVGRKASVDWGQELAALPGLAAQAANVDSAFSDASSGFTTPSEDDSKSSRGGAKLGTSSSSRSRPNNSGTAGSMRSGLGTPLNKVRGTELLMRSSLKHPDPQARLIHNETAAVLRKEVEKGLHGEGMASVRRSIEEDLDIQQIRELEASVAATAMNNFMAIASFLKSSGVDLTGTDGDQINDRLAEAHATAMKCSVENAVRVYKSVGRQTLEEDDPEVQGKAAGPQFGRTVGGAMGGRLRRGSYGEDGLATDGALGEGLVGLAGESFGKVNALRPKKADGANGEELLEAPPERAANAEEWLNFFQGKSKRRNSGSVLGNPAFGQPMNDTQRLGLRTRLKPLRSQQKSLPGMQVGNALSSTKLQDGKAPLAPGVAVARDRSTIMERQGPQLAEGSLEDMLEIRAGQNTNKAQTKWKAAAALAMGGKPPLPGARLKQVVQSAREARGLDDKKPTTPRLDPLSDPENHQVDASRWLVRGEDGNMMDGDGPRVHVAPQRMTKKREGVLGKKLAALPGHQAHADKLSGETQGDGWLQVKTLDSGAEKTPRQPGSAEARAREGIAEGIRSSSASSSRDSGEFHEELKIEGAGHQQRGSVRQGDLHVPDTWRSTTASRGEQLQLEDGEEAYEQQKPHSARIMRGRNFTAAEDEEYGSLTERAIVPHISRSSLQGPQGRKRGSDTIGALVSRVREQLEKTHGSLAASWVHVESSYGDSGLTLGGLQRGMVEAGVLPDDAGIFIQAMLESQMSAAAATIPGDRAPARADFMSALLPGKLRQQYYDAAQRRASSGNAWWSEGRISPNFHISRYPDGLTSRDANTILTSRPLMR